MPEQWIQPDERLVAFQRGYAVYEKLHAAIPCFREQCPSASQLMMQHVTADISQAEVWADHFTWTGRDGQVVQVALSWYCDIWNSCSLEFQMFFRADFTALGLADVASLALKWRIPYLSVGCLVTGPQVDDVFPKIFREEIIL